MKLSQFRNTIQNIYEVWYNEIVRIFRDQGILTFIVLLPLAYPVIYSWIYNNERVNEVPVTVVDQSHSSLSREFIRKFDASAEVNVIAYATSIEDAKLPIMEKKSEGILLIPENFSESINRMESAKVGVFCDMNGMLFYKAIISTASDVALEMGKEIKIKLLGNTTKRQDEVSTSPIEYEYVPIFNPTHGYACFIIPAVLAILIQQTLLLGIGMGAGTDYERKKFFNLKYSVGQTLCGRTIAFLTMYAIIGTWLLIVVPYLFSFTQLTNASALFCLSIPYILSCIFFAITASVIIKEREVVMPFFVFTSLPLLFISGISWPASNIPWFLKAVSYLIPSTFGINGFQKVNSMGALVEDISFECKALWILCIFYAITSYIVIAMHKKKQEKENKS